VNSPLPQPRLGDRSLFPSLEAHAYLAHAAISPASLAVRRAVTELANDYERRGVRAFPTWNDQRAQLRTRLGQLINAHAEDIALTAGTTRGISDLALCFPWRRGDRIVCFRGEFPANVTPWQRAAELFGLDVVWLDAIRYVRDTEEGLHELDQTLKGGGVRLVAVSAVQFQTGLFMPLRQIGELCRTRGAALAVDAIQACGAVPVDVQAWQADYVTCGAHKWLMGLEGCGFLWVHPERVAELQPHTAGWLSHEAGADFLSKGRGLLKYDRPLKKSAAVFEGSTSSAIGYAALAASLELLQTIGVPAIFAHLQAYLDGLEHALVERGFKSLRSATAEGRSGSLCTEAPTGTSVTALHASLMQQGIVTSMPDGYLRFAPHWPNCLDEVPMVLEAIDTALAARS
jgi:selenocysteine lyase/cysteine desulfurase